MKKERYVAHYQPNDKQYENIVFDTEKDAEEYIINESCKECKDSGEGLGSACACEWLIVPLSKFKKAKTHFDLMEAAGFKRIR